MPHCIAARKTTRGGSTLHSMCALRVQNNARTPVNLLYATARTVFHTVDILRAALRRPLHAMCLKCPAGKPRPSTKRGTAGIVAGYRVTSLSVAVVVPEEPQDIIVVGFMDDSVADWSDCSPPTMTNQFRFLPGSLLDFRAWESWWTWLLVSGFSRGYNVSHTLAFQCSSIRTSLHPHRLSRLRCYKPPRSLHSITLHRMAYDVRTSNITVGSELLGNLVDALRHRIMVAEFVARQSGSPINGETPSLNSTMPGSHMHSSSLVSTAQGGMCGPDGPIMDSSRPGSPDREHNGYSPGPGFDLSNHLKRKELFSQRKQREFIPDNKKDESYWDRRRRNNEAAKRSREKRRFNDMILETRVVELSKENHVLKAQLAAIKDKFGISGESVVSVEQVMATLPTSEQVLNITKRAKLSGAPPPPIIYPPIPSPIPTSVIHQPVITNIGSPPTPFGHFHPQPIQDQTCHQHQLPVESNVMPEPEVYPYSFPLPPLHPPSLEQSNINVLNLSCSRSRVQSPYEVSSGDENSVSGPIALTTTIVSTGMNVNNCNNNNSHNSLPHKLRHKSHLGDKDAASALLALQNIKQEPGPRASPPWDGEGSSDERDSGISLGVDWMATTAHGLQQHTADGYDCTGDELQLKSELARLASESPDLNPIECLWDELDHRVRARQVRPKSIAQLMIWFQGEWRWVPVDILQTLVESMHGRLAAVIAARGLELKGGGNGNPKKIHRPVASSGTNPTCENLELTWPGIELGLLGRRRAG
ncbi:hypothetical protein PR048_012956 [Dryococelus australis]|uniref:BZIP domain-containing protein n=1 Tax=Dryococelus australis TaxID=614101 RepID=A0ABQ9HQV0_9NEOP|nr:hypothetical protein PR048_012956 [Dryococelus australis]